MPKFYYIAKVSPKEVVEDTMDADTREDALRKISLMGYTPLQVREKEDAQDAGVKDAVDSTIPSKHMEAFTRQFASLLRSQIPILRALKVLEEQTEHKKLKMIVLALHETIEREGTSISEAMNLFPKAFPADYVNLVHAGEIGGALQEVLDQLAEKMEKEQILKTKIQNSLIYPCFVGVAGILTVMVLIMFVMPRILGILERLRVKLPLPTRILMAMTDLLTSHYFWIFVGVAALAGVAAWKNVVLPNKGAIDRLLLKVPSLGKLIFYIEMVRFTRSLGLLLSHGVLILQALEVSIPVVGNRYIKTELEKLPRVVKEGNPLTEGLKALAINSPYLVHSLSVGEESGRISEALMEVSKYYEREASTRMQIFASLLEPAMILGVGLMVGFIVMAVLLPIFEVSSTMR